MAGTLPAVASLFAVLALGERPSRALLASSALASAAALSAVMSALGLLVCLPPALLERAWARPVPAAVWAAVYYALVPGVLGFWLWFAGSQRLAGHLG